MCIRDRCSKLLFGNNPIDAGLSISEYWNMLVENKDAQHLKEMNCPSYDSFFHQTYPRPLKNQLTILLLIGELTRNLKSSLTYVCWPTGLGKTTSMMELGHILCLHSLT